MQILRDREDENEINNFGRMLLGGLALLAAAVARRRPAQDAAANFPNKPIRVIVPFAAGGGNDIFARLVGQKAGKSSARPWSSRTGRAPAAARRGIRHEPAARRLHAVRRRERRDVDRRGRLSEPAYHPTKTFVPLSMIANFPLILVVRRTIRRRT